MARHKNRVLPLHRQLKPADRASAWNALLLDSPGNAAGCVIPCCLLVDKLASTEGEAAAVDYDRLVSRADPHPACVHGLSVGARWCA